jgi:hypothetical protein
MGELRHRRIPLRRVLLQAARDDGRQAARHRRGQLRGRVGDHGREHGADARAVERQAPREQLVRDDAERPHVHARVDVLRAAHLLGGHVRRRPERRGGAGEALRALVVARVHGLREPEIDDLHAQRAEFVPCEEQVRALHVAVDDAERVGGAEPRARLEQQRHRALGRERAFALDDGREVAPLEELHREVGGAALEHADVQHAHDVRVRDPPRRRRLAHEAGAHLGVRGHRGLEQLHGDAATRAHVLRREDRADAARAELRREPVPRGDDRPDGGQTVARGARVLDGGAHDGSLRAAEGPRQRAALGVTGTPAPRSPRTRPRPEGA